jgi:hypothetical protein
MEKMLLMCVALVGLTAASAQAMTIGGSSVTLGAGDVGQMFAIDFNGLADEQPVSGVKSVAVFELLAYNTTLNYVEFSVALKNTSDSGVTSRTSALGFATTPDVTTASISGAGLFDNVVVGGNFPNYAAIELCLTDGNNCQGAGNGGVATGAAAGVTSFRLNFDNLQASLLLDSFAVRYQAVAGAQGNADHGVGTPRQTESGDPTPRDVAEPTTLVLAGVSMLCAGFARRRART